MRPIPLNRDELGSDVFGFKRRFPVLNQHRDHLTQVGVKLIQCITLRMSTWETGDETDKEARLWTFFNHRSKGTHNFSIHLPSTEGNIRFAQYKLGMGDAEPPFSERLAGMFRDAGKEVEADSVSLPADDTVREVH